MLGSLIQNGIRGCSSASGIHLVANGRHILVLDRLVAPVSTLARFRFVAPAGHLTSRLTLTGRRRHSVRGVALVYVLGAAQVVIAGCPICVDGVITRLQIDWLSVGKLFF